MAFTIQSERQHMNFENVSVTPLRKRQGRPVNATDYRQRRSPCSAQRCDAETQHPERTPAASELNVQLGFPDVNLLKKLDHLYGRLYVEVIGIVRVTQASSLHSLRAGP